MTAAVGAAGIPTFNNSPAGVAIGGIVLGPGLRARTSSFMNALTVPEPSAHAARGSRGGAGVDRPAKASARQAAE